MTRRRRKKLEVDVVTLFYMRRDFGGGATSFTVHLFEGLRRAGFSPQILRVAARSEEKQRPLAKYAGVTYRNVSIDDAILQARSTPSVMTAPVHSKDVPFAPDAIERLMRWGMRAVTHDPNEFKVYDHLEDKKRVHRPICIRPTMRRFFEDAVFISHPYAREFPERSKFAQDDREWLAVSVARTSFVKRTTMILEANSGLDKDRRVVLRGAENRMYSHHVLDKKHPTWREDLPEAPGFPMEWGASARECARARFAVDMTYFPDDGGGSQYSLMEAWDAGTVNVIHRDWLRYPGEMRDLINCVAVDGADGLRRLLLNADRFRRRRIVEAGYRQLDEVHDAEQVARQYVEELLR